MCGICGVYGYRSKQPVSARLLDQMVDSMTHRGPDERGRTLDAEFGFGMRRLSIIDLAGGSQPMTNESGSLAVILNGEIYNYRDLRDDLLARGHVFRTNSDTEVVVHAYEEWGMDGIDALNGMFGLALWDAVRRELVVARDPFGVKPLYWWDNGHELAFASDVRALLLHPSVPRAVNAEALSEYIRLGFVPAPATAFDGINAVTPGYALVCARGGPPSMVRYVSALGDPVDVTMSEAVDRLRPLLEDSVGRQMIADVPVGLMLSGGVDSAALAAMMSARHPEPIKTFTVGFSQNFKNNELAAARRTSELLGTQHHEVVISASEYLDFLPEATRLMEVPLATWQTLPFYRVSELAAEHVKVVLTGQGADEPFAGYRRHLAERYGSAYRRLPRGMQELIASVAYRLPRTESFKRAADAVGEEETAVRLWRTYSTLDDGTADELLGGDQSGRRAPEWLTHWLDEASACDDLGAMTFVDARTLLADNLLLYGDKMSMAVSLEARVPYLDRELMGAVERFPAKVKIRGRKQKAVLKKAVEKWLPDEIIERRKVGFAVPMDEWLRTTLREHLRDILLESSSGAATYFDRDVMARLIREHANGIRDWKRILFALMAFEYWHEAYVRPTSWPSFDNRGE